MVNPRNSKASLQDSKENSQDGTAPRDAEFPRQSGEGGGTVWSKALNSTFERAELSCECDEDTDQKVVRSDADVWPSSSSG